MQVQIVVFVWVAVYTEQYADPLTVFLPGFVIAVYQVGIKRGNEKGISLQAGSELLLILFIGGLQDISFCTCLGGNNKSNRRVGAKGQFQCFGGASPKRSRFSGICPFV